MDRQRPAGAGADREEDAVREFELKHDCARFAALVGRDVADQLEAGERAFSSLHLASCVDCALLRDMVAAAQDPSVYGPAEPLGEIAERRVIEQILEAAEEVDGPSSIRPRHLRYWAAAAAVVMVLAGALLAALWGQMTGRSSVPPTVAPLLVGGDAVIESTAPPNTSVAVQSRGGVAGLALEHGFRLLAMSGTQIEVRRSRDGGLTVDLLQGRILVSRSSRAGQPVALAVHTPRTTVRVSGTVFAVTAAPGPKGSDVEVLRGEVQVRLPEGRERPVRAGSGLRLGAPPYHLTAEAVEALTSASRVLAATSDAKGAATLRIETLPAGATVSLDGMVVGQSPLLVRHDAGSVALSVSLAEHTPVSEQVDLGASDQLERRFVLQKQAPEEPRTPQSSAHELLEAARRMRLGRKWAAAATAYERLIRGHPDSAEARPARVALADMALRQLGQPMRALRQYRLYLERDPDGPLAREALDGQAAAFRELGRLEDERRVLKQLVARYPDAISAAAARERLRQLGEGR